MNCVCGCRPEAHHGWWGPCNGPCGCSYFQEDLGGYGTPPGTTYYGNGNQHNQYDGLLMASSVLCLLSALPFPEPRGAVTEVAGMLGVATALLYYTLYLPDVVPEAWSTSMALGFSFIAVGCILRAGIVGRMIRHRETW